MMDLFALANPSNPFQQTRIQADFVKLKQKSFWVFLGKQPPTEGYHSEHFKLYLLHQLTT
jgi:hypothetical protein